MCGDPEVATVYDVVSAEPINGQPALNRQRLGSSVEGRRQIHVSSPTAVSTGEQFCNLPQLALLPCGDQMHRSLAKAGGTQPCCIDLDLASIGQVRIGAHGSSFDASAPGIFGILPKRQI